MPNVEPCCQTPWPGNSGSRVMISPVGGVGLSVCCLFMVRSDYGFYILVELSEHRRRERTREEREQAALDRARREQAEEARWTACRERYEAARRRLQEVE